MPAFLRLLTERPRVGSRPTAAELARARDDRHRAWTGARRWRERGRRRAGGARAAGGARGGPGRRTAAGRPAVRPAEVDPPHASPTCHDCCAPGDVLVVNTSGHAAGRRAGRRTTALVVHFSTRWRDGAGWSSCAAHGGTARTARLAGRPLPLPGGAHGHARGAVLAGPVVGRATSTAAAVAGFLRAVRPADPVRLRGRRVAAATTRRCSPTEPGSAEMPSAGRPFTVGW